MRLREKNARLSRCRCSYSSARRSRHPLAQHGHQPQPHQGRRLAHHIHERHRRHGEPGDHCGATAVEPAFLRRPDHAVDHVSREVRRHQAHERDQRCRRHTECEPPAVRREVAEQAPDDRDLTTGHEGLGVANRARDARRVFLVRVRRRDGAALERLFEHELQVLERAPLAMAVAQHGEWGVAGAPQDRQRAGGQTGGLAHRLNVGALDALDLPLVSALQRPGHAQLPGAERDPHLGQPESVVQVGERVELHRGAVPGCLDLPAQLGRQPGRLVGIARHNLGVEVVEVLEVVKVSRHARDPCFECPDNKNGLPGFTGAPREAGSRQWILSF